ncbi:MAG: WYL domain-containing protein [Coriobacteriia bacterium]|nr:WYL domain-containing protein [Coriobacteriia bacterium]
MPDAVERLVNLALLLASTRQPVTAARARAAGLGYPDSQDDIAFIRMFERDKDALRAAGLVIEVVTDGGTEAYRLDADATYARPIELAPDEMAAIGAVAAALAEDPGFPFRNDLVLALGKLGTSSLEHPLSTTQTVDDDSAGQGLYARALAEAIQTRKTVTFDYTNAQGESRRRIVDPYGVFFRGGIWYLAGQDRDADATRTYAVSRIRDLDVNPLRPHTPDFERPEEFDVREHERLPFELGATAITARIRFEPEIAWRAESLARGRGSIAMLSDGSAVWTVPAADLQRLASWLVDEGPGLHPVEPPELVSALCDGLRAVVSAHE